MKKIILTGGGTAGHVTPNIALLPALKRENYDVIYVGSSNGMEKELIANNDVCNIKYYGISSGKLRRYLDLKNITDMFRVIKGLGEAVKIIRNEKPDVVFSKGGFVIVPVVIAAKLCGVPIIIHESDISPGLANKISMPFASVVCVSFPETLERVPKDKGVVTGSPIRSQLSQGDRASGLRLCGFNSQKPIALVMGGSSGSAKINECLRKCLPSLVKNIQIIHLCGKGNVDASINFSAYKQFEYVSEELPNLLAAADIVVSRAGANSIFEFLSLNKPNLLIPLSRKASRGDQIQNAESFAAMGFSKVLFEEELDETSLLVNINELYCNRDKFIANMSKNKLHDGVESVMQLIRKY